jgi:microcystin degradation protein MlrC
MPAPRVAIGGVQHETNTFAPIPTRWPEFEVARAWPGYTEGAAIFSAFAGLNLAIAGFMEEARDWDVVPLLWCEAAPSGTVEQATFDRIVGRLIEMLAAAGSLDAVYLDLHGAMVTDDHVDGEAEILRRVRDAVGPELPVAVSLDLHGNLSRAFFERASCVTIYRTYPHLDFAETGARCARLLGRLLERGRPFTRAWRQLDYLIPITQQSTRREPGRRLYAMLPGLEGNGRATIFAYGDDQVAVDRAADAMLDALRGAEEAFHNPLVPAAEAVRQAKQLGANAGRPVIIADPQDNPGAGAPGDSTGLLRALLDEGARGAALSMFWDPHTAAQAHAAGLGADIEISLGGRFPEIGGPPIKIRAVMERLSDGVIPLAGPVLTGTAHLGPMACLRLVHDRAEVRVVVGSGRCQNADLELFRALGIVPEQQKILAVKSAVHFLGAYEPIAEAVIFAEAPGANPCRLDRLPFTRLRPGVRLGPRGPVFYPSAGQGARQGSE